jgi:AraC-like DNA-binding protein
VAAATVAGGSSVGFLSPRGDSRDPIVALALLARLFFLGLGLAAEAAAASASSAAPPQANAMSYRFYANQCQRLSAVMQEPLAYADVVRSRLRASTPIPALPEVVSALHLTQRTLQRRLDEEGTSYSALLAEVRLERATELMRRSGLQNDEFARALGFDDASAFSRAFKSWTGVSPRQYRERQRSV